MMAGGLLQDATKMKHDVLSAMHFTAQAWWLVTHAMIKNWFVQRDCGNDHASSSDDSAVKLTENKDDDWHSLQPHKCNLKTT
jgi:hypothetical protein